LRACCPGGGGRAAASTRSARRPTWVRSRAGSRPPPPSSTPSSAPGSTRRSRAWRGRRSRPSTRAARRCWRAATPPGPRRTRAGAGLTTLAVPATLQPVLEAQVREAMTAALPDTSDGAALDALLAGRAAVVCGPGLGQAAETRALVAHVIRRSAAPLVLDADG